MSEASFIVALTVCCFSIISSVIGVGWRLSARFTKLEVQLESVTKADVVTRLTRLEEQHDALVEALEFETTDRLN